MPSGSTEPAGHSLRLPAIEFSSAARTSLHRFRFITVPPWAPRDPDTTPPHAVRFARRVVHEDRPLQTTGPRGWIRGNPQGTRPLGPEVDCLGTLRGFVFCPPLRQIVSEVSPLLPETSSVMARTTYYPATLAMYHSQVLCTFFR